MHAIFDEILEIEELAFEECEMYDIGMVDTPHTFFANDLLVHNSAYFTMEPFLIKKFGSLDIDEELIIQELMFHSKRIEDLLNKSYEAYAYKYHNLKAHRWNIKQEKIARRAFWGKAKKRYAMWVIVNEGTRCEKPMIKGFDSVRSDFPQLARDFMEDLIIGILKDKPREELNKSVLDFKGVYTHGELMDVLAPSGVKEISKYEGAVKGIPIHVNSAKNYNRLLAYLKLDEEYPNIEDGDKVLWGYLKQNPLNFRSLAIRGDGDPAEVVEYLEKYADKEQIFNSALLNKLQAIWDDLGWGQIQMTQDNEDFF